MLCELLNLARTQRLEVDEADYCNNGLVYYVTLNKVTLLSIDVKERAQHVLDRDFGAFAELQQP